jgi:TonB family protein
MKIYACLALTLCLAGVSNGQSASAKQGEVYGVVRDQQGSTVDHASASGVSVTRFVAPIYPHIAKTARIEGDVRISLIVSTTGTPENVQVMSGHPMLTQAAIDSVKQWRFGLSRPDREANHTVVFRFRLPPGTALEPAPPLKDYLQPQLPCTVTIWGEPPGIEDGGPYSPCPKKRSVLCLYLWRCKPQACRYL